MNRNLNSFCWVLTIAFTLGAVSVGVVKAQENAAKADDASKSQKDEEYYELMRVFVETFQEIDRNYVKEVDRRELVEAAVRGMLTELDPYSDYISPDDLNQFTEAISQEFGGVGIRVNFEPKLRAIQVMTPLPGSPAYDAGIHSGDLIVDIDGHPVKDFPLDREIDEAIKLLRGKPGESVTVKVRRVDSMDIDTIDLVRDIIKLDTVMGYSYNDDGSWNFMYDDEEKIGYLRLTHFTKRSAAEVRAALKQLKKDGMKSLILDLRFNPGGLLSSAIEISDMFVEKGKIVSTKGRNTQERTWPAKRFGTFTGFPMAVLVNRYSASASEIVSACLQDHDRAIVVGERSWGKGSVQNVIDLEGGKSNLKLTIASYHRPSGKNIHRFPDSKEDDEWGVMPNDGYLVKFNREQLIAYQADRRERDIIGREGELESDFVDTQIEAALRSLETSTEATVEQDGEEAPKVKPKQNNSKKAAFRMPLIPVPKLTVG